MSAFPLAAPARAKTTLVTLLLLSLFSAYFTSFATGRSMWTTGLLSIDKFAKATIILLAFLVALLQRKRLRLSRHLWTYVLPGCVLLLCFVAQWWDSPGSDDFAALRAQKEIIRLAVMLAMFVICDMVCPPTVEYRTIIYSFAIAGLLLGLLALRQTISGAGGYSDFLYVEGYLRAGSGMTDANMIGAVLNIASVAALAGWHVQTQRFPRMLMLSLFAVAQAGRFATFSTGSFLGLAVTLVSAAWLLRRHFRRGFGSFLRVMLGVAAACILIGVWKPALPATVFYRVTFSDTKVKQDSIDSRLRQYDRYLNLISEKPSALIWGAGPAGLHRALHGDLHNSYLRAWAVGGILGFGAFLYLCGNCLRDFLLSIRRSRGSELHHVVSIYFLAAFLGWSCQAATVPADTSCIQWFFFMLAYLLRRSTCTLPTGPVPRPQGLVRPCMFPRWRVCAARP